MNDCYTDIVKWCDPLITEPDVDDLPVVDYGDSEGLTAGGAMLLPSPSYTGDIFPDYGTLTEAGKLKVQYGMFCEKVGKIQYKMQRKLQSCYDASLGKNTQTWDSMEIFQLICPTRMEFEGVGMHDLVKQVIFEKKLDACYWEIQNNLRK